MLLLFGLMFACVYDVVVLFDVMQRRESRRCASRALMCMLLGCFTVYLEVFETYLDVVSKSLSQIWTDS